MASDGPTSPLPTPLAEDANVEEDIKAVNTNKEEELEILKAFTESRDFYFSYTLDLTNSFQRKFAGKYSKSLPLVRRVCNSLFEC